MWWIENVLYVTSRHKRCLITAAMCDASMEIEHKWIRQFRLLSWSSLIGQFIIPQDNTNNLSMENNDQTVSWIRFS